jgi:hypothetical protein
MTPYKNVPPVSAEYKSVIAQIVYGHDGLMKNRAHPSRRVL